MKIRGKVFRKYSNRSSRAIRVIHRVNKIEGLQDVVKAVYPKEMLENKR